MSNTPRQILKQARDALLAMTLANKYSDTQTLWQVNATKKAEAAIERIESLIQKPHANQVFAWECSVKGAGWSRTINHFTAGKARYEYLIDVRESYPDVTFADISVRKVGAAQTTEAFKRTARYRGLPDLQCGQRVTVGQARGTVVGHNDSANFDVLFDADSPEFAGLTLNVHPSEMRPLNTSPKRNT